MSVLSGKSNASEPGASLAAVEWARGGGGMPATVVDEQV